MENVLELFQQFWLDFQQGQLPDVGSWNYMVMAVLLMIQGRFSAVVSGIAAAAGYLNLGLIIFIALMARVAVDVLWYKLGSSGAIDRIGRRVNTVQRITGQVSEGVNQRPFRLVFIAKVFSGVGVPLIISAGSSRVPFRRWLPASFTGELVGTVPLLFLGYFATDALSKINGTLSILSLGGTVVIGLALILRSLRSYKKQVTIQGIDPIGE